MSVAADPRIAAPWKGLAPFDDSDVDALLFFGRERETDVVAANALAARLTVLYGPTGVGKSSLLRAGVVHQLRARSDADDLAVAYFSSWAGDPALGIDESVRGALADAFGGDPGDAPGDLVDRVDGWTAALGAQLVLVLDQFEEHFLYHEQGGLHELLPELVTRPGLRVNVVLGIRDDELARLDVFKARIPMLFSNYLRLDRLTREQGRAAILGPLERYNMLADDHVEVEPPLVERVLDEVAVGRIDAGPVDETRVETPYLQLVLQRLWDVERGRRSSVLRLATLAELGGAQRIVEDHLERAMSALTPAQRDVAAGMFDHLVTPSGTKIAHGVADLASFAHVDPRDLRPVLASLATERILRPTGDAGAAGDRYEIYHDVLAGAVLGWKAQHEAAAALARERAAARSRQRRLALVAGIAVLAFALMAALAAYAFSQRATARRQAHIAQVRQADAVRAEKAAQRSRASAVRARGRALAAKRKATRATAAAIRQKHLADAATADANAEARSATDAKNAALAAQSSLAATVGALKKTTSALRNSEAHLEQTTRRANASAEAASRSARLAKQKTKQALAAVSETRASELLAQAQAQLDIDPLRSVRDALRSTAIKALPSSENVLRRSLLANHVLAILPASGQATDARFSPDGSRVAVTGSGGDVAVYTRSGRLVRSLAAGEPLARVAWSPDGTEVAAAALHGTVRVWDVATKTLVHTFPGVAPVADVAFTPDGRVLEVAGGPAVKLWDAASGVLLHTVVLDRNVHSAELSSNGQLLLTTTGRSIARVWSTATGGLVQTLQAQTAIRSAAFGPNGDLVVTGSSDATAAIWNVRTGTIVQPITGDTASIDRVAFSPAGNAVAIGGPSGAVRVYNLSGGTLDEERDFTSPIADIAFSPDGQAEIGLEQNGHAVSSGPGQLPVMLDGQSGPGREALFSPDGRTVATVAGTQVRLWDPYGEPRVRGIRKASATVTSLAFAPTGSLLASAGSDGVVDLRRTPSGKPVSSFAVGAPVVSIAWARDGTMLVATKDGTLHLRDVQKVRDRRVLHAGGPVVSAALRSDGDTVAAARSDGTVLLWNARTGRRLATFEPGSGVTAVALDPTLPLVAVAVGPDVDVYRTDTRTLATTLTGHSDVVTSLAFSHDGVKLVSGSRDHDARVWNMKTFAQLQLLARHTSTVAGVAFSQDDRWVATAGAAKAGVWSTFPSDLPGGFLFFARGNVPPLTAVAWSPQGWMLATASRDGSVRVLSCALCGRLPQLRSAARAVARRFPSG